MFGLLSFIGGVTFSTTERITEGNREKKGARCVHSFSVGSLRLLFSCLSLPPVMTSHFGLILDLSYQPPSSSSLQRQRQLQHLLLWFNT